MELIKGLIQNFSKKTFSIIILGLTLFMFWSIYFVSESYNIRLKLFTGDPLSTFNVNPLTGVVSNIGILLWCAAAAILFFTFFLVIGKVENSNAWFLLYSALLTAILLFDDLFMFHEHILKSVGIEEIVMYGIYVILFGILFLVFFRILISAKFKFFLIITFISFGSSVIIDLLFEDEKFRILFEDGFKFLGIVCWFMFFTFYCLEQTKNAFLKDLKS